MNILETIKAHKIKEVAQAKHALPIAKLKDDKHFSRNGLSFSTALSAVKFPAIIAEHKRKSPSKGSINTLANLKKIVKTYQEYGATCISILTDSHFFGGSENDLREARTEVTIPILRKDFIVDSYQIYEAKAMGADCILLISEICTKKEIEEWTKLAHDLGLEVLLELHSKDQLGKIATTVNAIGINNRNLKTFEVDLQKSIALLTDLPHNVPKIAESGLKNAETLIGLHKAGFDAFLMGERFMRNKQPGAAFKNFMHEF